MTPEELGILLGLTGRNIGSTLGQAAGRGVGNMGFPAAPMIPARNVMGGVEQFGEGFIGGLSGQPPTTPAPSTPQPNTMPSGAFDPRRQAELAAIQAGVRARNASPAQETRATTPPVDPTPARGELRYSLGTGPNKTWQTYTPSQAANSSASFVQGSDEQQMGMRLNRATAETALATKEQELAQARLSPYEKAQLIAASRAKQGDPVKSALASSGMSMIQDPNFGQSLARKEALDEYTKAYPGKQPPPGYLDEASKRVDPAIMFKMLLALAQAINRGGQDVMAFPEGSPGYPPGQ